MEHEFDYYLIGNDYTKSVPDLMSDDGQNTMFLHGKEPIEELDTPIKLCLCPPIPAKPRMVDFHEMPSSVFSGKIAKVLKSMNIYGLQLIPATVRGKGNDRYDDYWVAYVYNRIPCLDLEHSEYDVDKDDGWIHNVLKYFMDNTHLAKIPLEKRLVFLMEESMSKRIYHKSVVDAIMSLKPVGITFSPIPVWFEGNTFYDEEDW